MYYLYLYTIQTDRYMYACIHTCIHVYIQFKQTSLDRYNIVIQLFAANSRKSRRRLSDPVIEEKSKHQCASLVIHNPSILSRFLLNDFNTNRVLFLARYHQLSRMLIASTPLSSLSWNSCAICAANSDCQSLDWHPHILLIRVDYKNGHDCSCSMSIYQGAYLLFKFAATLSKRLVRRQPQWGIIKS